MSDVADDVRARVEEATTVSSSDDTEVYHHGDLMAVVEERKDAWNVRVYRGNSEGQSIWEKEYDGRTSAESGAKSAMHQIEREDSGAVEEQHASKPKGKSHEYGATSPAVPEGENEPWERIEDLDELREGDQIRVATDADAANALNTSGVWAGDVRGNDRRDGLVVAKNENGRIILEYAGLDGVGDVLDGVSEIELGQWATVWKLRGMGKEWARASTDTEPATVGDTPHDDPFEQIRPGDVSEGDDLRLHLGPAAANHFGEEMIAGSVSRTSETDATIDLWDRAPVKWDVSNRLVEGQDDVIGVVERVERVRGMGKEHAKVGSSGMVTNNPTADYDDQTLMNKYDSWRGRSGALYRAAAHLAQLEMRDRGLGGTGTTTQNPVTDYGDKTLRRRFEEWRDRSGALYRAAAFLAERQMRERGLDVEARATGGVQAAHGGPFERFEEIYGVFQPRYGEFARGGIFGKQFYETAEEAQELLEQAREDGAEDAFIARITPAD